MEISNKSSKVICIGTTILLPDKTAVFPDDFSDLPSIKALESKGWLSISKYEDKSAKRDVTSSDKENDTEKPVKSTRKPRTAKEKAE